MSNDRPDIPAGVKRAVRRACGFGCAICGLPIFQYDHIVDYATMPVHTVENLVLLCPTHHQHKTSKRLPRDFVATARANPINLRRDKTAPDRWHFSGDEVEFRIGSNVFGFPIISDDESERAAICINDITVFGFKLSDGEILLSARLQDHRGRDVFTLEDGEVVVDTGVFDYDIVGPRVVIRDAERSILMEILKRDNGIEVLRGQFYEGLTHLVIEPHRVLILPQHNEVRGTHIYGCRTGLSISGPRFPTAANEMYFDPRLTNA